MDKKFLEFEKWYLNKRTKWGKVGIVVDKAGLEEQGHQYLIKLHSQNGIGHIVLNKDNGHYKVDFKDANYDYDVMFLRSGIEFNRTDLDTYESEFINHILN